MAYPRKKRTRASFFPSQVDDSIGASSDFRQRNPYVYLSNFQRIKSLRRKSFGLPTSLPQALREIVLVEGDKVTIARFKEGVNQIGSSAVQETEPLGIVHDGVGFVRIHELKRFRPVGRSLRRRKPIGPSGRGLNQKLDKLLDNVKTIFEHSAVVVDVDEESRTVMLSCKLDGDLANLVVPEQEIGFLPPKNSSVTIKATYDTDDRTQRLEFIVAPHKPFSEELKKGIASLNL